MKTKVKLILNVNGTEIKLSTKEAQELHQTLDGMYGEKVVRHEYWNRPYQTPWPYVQWTTTSAPNNQFMADSPTTDVVYLSVGSDISQEFNGATQ